uniref:LRRCT domain-containing protein n=1 Tax=Calidris pygmaea TaxID=425635 RepID=A0A8C3PNV5_9CHAR
ATPGEATCCVLPWQSSPAWRAHLRQHFFSQGWADCNGKSLLHAPSSLPSNITGLDLSFNSLVMPHHGTLLMHFPSLRSLNLSSNALLALSPAVFSNLRALRLLDLSSCSIAYLHMDTFKGLGNLHTLLLRNNSLQKLEVPFFLPLKALFHLDLQHNALVSVDTWSLQLLEAVPQVRLEGNPWVCDCTVHPLQQWLQRRQGEQVGTGGRRGVGLLIAVTNLHSSLVREFFLWLAGSSLQCIPSTQEQAGIIVSKLGRGWVNNPCPTLLRVSPSYAGDLRVAPRAAGPGSCSSGFSGPGLLDEAAVSSGGQHHPADHSNLQQQ